MRVFGIISEYNPFHNGHAYQIEQARKAGATHIVAIMSGNFVQRGDVAVFHKWARAKACLAGGADLVIELPTPFAMASARDFAYAGVSLLHNLNGDVLHFGSECGEVALLKQVAECCQTAEEYPMFAEMLAKGYSHIRAREKTVEQLFGEEISHILRTPNNLLGLEYCRAITALHSNIEPMTIKRSGVAHHAMNPSGEFASASFLRELLLSGEWNKLTEYVPKAAFEIYQTEMKSGRAPCKLSRLDEAFLFQIRKMTASDIAKIVDVQEGLEHRLLRFAKESKSMEECIEKTTTKRYTKARIRRICCHILLGTQKNQFAKAPEYIRVLGISAKGAEILKRAQGRFDMVIESKFSKLVQSAFKQAEFEAMATDVYALSMPKLGGCEMEFRQPMIRKTEE